MACDPADAAGAALCRSRTKPQGFSRPVPDGSDINLLGIFPKQTFLGVEALGVGPCNYMCSKWAFVNKLFGKNP
jgi:hypothetical protein